MSNFPTAYDVALGDVVDYVSLTLNGAIDNSINTVTFNETALIDSLTAPFYIVFSAEDIDNDFEIIYVTAKGGAGTGIVTATRGADSSEAQSHADGEAAIHELTSAYVSLIRDIIFASEQFTGLVGTSLPGTCEPGEMYIKTDTSEAYFCAVANTWILMNKPDHGAYALLGADDHAQYHNDTRKGEWHDNQGGYEETPGGDHLTNPTTHKHTGIAGQGEPVAKWVSGTSLPGSPTNIGDVFLKTDAGTLYVSTDGISWSEYVAIPKGTLLYFDSACPIGWTQEASLDDKFLKGAATGVWSGLSSGGSSTHTHDMDDLLTHTHTYPSRGVSLNADGAHSHTIPTGNADGTGGGRPAAINAPSQSSLDSSGAGGHTHSVTVSSVDSDGYGEASPKTDAESSLPVNKKLIMCKKD